MKTRRLLSLLLLFILISTSLSVGASAARSRQQQQGSTAELSIYPLGVQSMIIPNNKTTIQLQFIDTFGINWTKFQNIKQYSLIGKLSPLHGRIYSFITVRVLWPIIHRAWRPFLGYCTINLNASVLGNNTGWSVGINPSTIVNSTDGRRAVLDLQVYVNDLTSQNTAMVRVTAQRILTDGTVYGTSTFDIPLRSSKLNSIQVTPDSPVKNAGPSTIVPFTINIKNQGYFLDSFGIRVNESSTKIQASVSDQSITLSPGQSTDVTLWVMTPTTFYDPGTSYPINISVYSLNNKGSPFYGGVQVRSSGLYLSGLVLSGIGVGFLFVLLILFLFFIVFERRAQEVYGKPAKPWKIPEEQLALMELKKNNPDAYGQERAMMTQEYRSALGYYKDSRRTARFQPKETKQKKPLLAPLSKRLKSVHLPKKQKPKAKPKKNKEEPAATTATSTIDTEREKALQRFQKEQAKQQRRK